MKSNRWNKKIGMALIFFTLVTGGNLWGSNTVTFAADATSGQTEAVKVKVDGRKASSAPVSLVVNNRTMIPMMSISQTLDASVSWDQHRSVITVVKGRDKISLQIGNPSVRVNDREVAMDAPPILKEGEILVPLRFISEALGARVEWKADTRTVEIQNPKAGVVKELYKEELLKEAYPIAAVTVSEPGANESLKPENMIDRDATTFWGNGKAGTEIIVDLGSEKKTNYVAIAWNGGDQKKYHFELLGSKDGKAFAPLASLQSSGKTEDPELYEMGEHTLQAVKVICNGNDAEKASTWSNLFDIFVGHKDKETVLLDKPQFQHVFQTDAPRYTSFIEKNGVISMEAENYSYQEGFDRMEDSKSSGNHYMKVQETIENKGGTLRYDFTVETGGRWYVWLHTLAPAAEDNGMFILLDGKLIQAPKDHMYAGVEDIYLKKGNWQWEPEWNEAGSGIHAGPVIIELEPGEHSLRIAKRKGERPHVDKIVLTRESERSWKDAAGPGETLRQVSDAADPEKGKLSFDTEGKHSIAAITASEVSSNQKIKPENMVDGNLATVWGVGVIGVEITMDLGSELETNYVAIAWSKGDEKKHFFEIQGSVDGEKFYTIAELESSGTTSDFETFSFEKRQLRYVKIIGKGNNGEKSSNWFNVLEMMVGSKP